MSEVETRAAGRTAVRIGTALVRQRWLALVIGLAVLAITALGLVRAEMQGDYRAFVGRDNPDLITADWIQERASGAGETLILLYRPASGTLFDDVSVLQYAKIADLAKKLPHVTDATSMFDADKLVRIGAAPPGASPGERHRVVPLLFPHGLFGADALAALKTDALATPLIGGRTIARDGSSGLVLLSIDMPATGPEREARMDDIADGADAIAAQVAPLRRGDTVTLIGPALFERASADILRHDAAQLAPIALLLFFGLFFLVFRSVVHALVVVAIILAACTSALGIAAAVGITFTILSFSALMLVGTLSTAEALHVITTYAVHRREGEAPAEAMAGSITINFWPIVTTSLTTAVGEAVLLASASPAVRDMGLIMLIGAVMALFFTFTLVPALAMLARGHPGGWIGGSASLFDRLARLSSQHPGRVLMATASISLVLLPGLGQNALRDTMSGWFGASTEFRRGLDLLERDYLGIQTFSVATEIDGADLEAASAWPAVRPELARQIALDRDLAGIAHVRRWLGPAQAKAGFEARAGASGSGFALDRRTLADAGETARAPSLTMLSDAGLMSPYEPGRQLYLLRHADAAGTSNAELLVAARAAEAKVAAALPDREHRVGGMSVAFAQLGEQNVRNILSGSVAGLVVITLCLAVAFRSLRLAAWSLVPNVMPIALVFGGWGWLVGEINLAATTVVSIALGIVVDDTTHVVMKYNRYRRAGYSPEDAASQTIRLGGPAIVVTSIVLASGFLLLGQSQFALTAQKATMVGLCILVAVIFDLTASPAMLTWLDRAKPRRTEALSA